MKYLYVFEYFFDLFENVDLPDFSVRSKFIHFSMRENAFDCNVSIIMDSN